VIGLGLLAFPCVVATSGCVSDDNGAPPPGGEDAAIPGSDATIPGHDAKPPTEAGDATTIPDAPESDSHLPDTSAPDVGVDAFDAGPIAHIRVAWFDDPTVLQVTAPVADASVPAAPRWDACFAPHGTGAWQGPLLAKAGSPGLALYDVSAYF